MSGVGWETVGSALEGAPEATIVVSIDGVSVTTLTGSRARSCRGVSAEGARSEATSGRLLVM